MGLLLLQKKCSIGIVLLSNNDWALRGGGLPTMQSDVDCATLFRIGAGNGMKLTDVLVEFEGSPFAPFSPLAPFNFTASAAALANAVFDPEPFLPNVGLSVGLDPYSLSAARARSASAFRAAFCLSSSSFSCSILRNFSSNNLARLRSSSAAFNAASFSEAFALFLCG
jgi:hypothetical protein